MNDEERPLLPDGSDAPHYGEALLYDLGKFLTTLSLFAIGGVLTLADSAERTDIKTVNLVVITIALAAAAALSASTAGSIAYGRYTGKAMPRYLHLYAKGAFMLLGVGLGMFISMWIDKIN
jgi:hypothetical protein